MPKKGITENGVAQAQIATIIKVTCLRVNLPSNGREIVLLKFNDITGSLRPYHFGKLTDGDRKQ